MDKICELVQVDGEFVQRERDATQEEQAAIDALRAAPPLVSQSISPRQIRQSLTHFGLRDSVESAVQAGDQDLKDWWEYATEFERSHPKVAQMGQALGVTDAQLDALWVYGNTL
jgi:hypothetical protein